MAFASTVHVDDFLGVNRIVLVRVDHHAEEARICVDKTSMIS